MIRPEQEGSAKNAPDAPPSDLSARDYWAYVQDERERYPHLWRALVRVHKRAFELAYPDIALDDVWKLGDIILRDVVRIIEARGGPAALGKPNAFRLQMPIFPAERQEPDFDGTWRGWLSVGKPERVY